MCLAGTKKLDCHKHTVNGQIIDSSGLFGIPSSISTTEEETRLMLHDHWIIWIPDVQSIMMNLIQKFLIFEIKLAQMSLNILMKSWKQISLVKTMI